MPPLASSAKPRRGRPATFSTQVVAAVALGGLVFLVAGWSGARAGVAVASAAGEAPVAAEALAGSAAVGAGVEDDTDTPAGDARVDPAPEEAETEEGESKGQPTAQRRPPTHPLSVLQRATPSHVVLDPYPHIILADALPAKTYDALVREFKPAAEVVRVSTGLRGARMRSNYRYSIAALDLIGPRPKSKLSATWKEFVKYHTSEAFVREATWVFAEGIKRYRPDFLLELAKRGFTIDNITATDKPVAEPALEIVINSPVESRSTVRGPHHDKINELYAGLLYMPEPRDTSKGGRFQVLACKKDCRELPNNPALKKKLGINPIGRSEQYLYKDLDLIQEAPYKPNTLAMFINSPVSVHAVTPRDKTANVRRYVNINCDVRTKLRVDEQMCDKRKGRPKGCYLPDDLQKTVEDAAIL